MHSNIGMASVMSRLRNVASVSRTVQCNSTTDAIAIAITQSSSSEADACIGVQSSSKHNTVKCYSIGSHTDGTVTC